MSDGFRPLLDLVVIDREDEMASETGIVVSMQKTRYPAVGIVRSVPQDFSMVKVGEKVLYQSALLEDYIIDSKIADLVPESAILGILGK